MNKPNDRKNAGNCKGMKIKNAGRGMRGKCGEWKWKKWNEKKGPVKKKMGAVYGEANGKKNGTVKRKRNENEMTVELVCWWVCGGWGVG